jgi:hypothetical protein
VGGDIYSHSDILGDVATSPTDSSLEGFEQCFLARFGYELNMNLKFLTLFLKYFWLPT